MCVCVCVCVVATGRSDGSNTQDCTAADSNKTPCLPLITFFCFFFSSGLWPVDLCVSFCNSLFISTKNYISFAAFYVSFFLSFQTSHIVESEISCLLSIIKQV